MFLLEPKDGGDNLTIINISYSSVDYKSPNPIPFQKTTSAGVTGPNENETILVRQASNTSSKRRCSIFFKVDEIITREWNCPLFIDVLDHFVFFLVNESEAIVFAREKMVVRRKTRRQEKKELEQGQGTPGTPGTPAKLYSDFARVRGVPLAHWIAPRENGTASPPSGMVYMKEHHCMIYSFVDGSVKVIRCDFLAVDEHNRNAQLLCDFTAHSSSEMCTVIPLPWSTVYGEAYYIEFLTFGSDNVVKHWGLRRQMDEALELVADNLGVS